jgi:succinoglycan biosynthesis transport protein ExoP
MISHFTMQNAGDEMTLRDYASVVDRRKWIVIAAVLIASIVALFLSVLQTPIYEASADILIEPRGQDGLFENQVVALNERAIQTEIQVIESDAIRNRVQAELGLAEPPPPVDASAAGETDVIVLAVRDASATNAQTYANAYAAAYIDVRRERGVEELLTASAEVQTAIDGLQEQIDALPEGDPGRTALFTQLANFNTTLDQLRVDAALRTGGAAIIRTAELPTDPVEPTPARTVVLAAVVGLLIGLGGAFLVDYLDDKIRGEADLERISDQPILAVLPTDRPTDHRPVSLSHPDHASVESYRGFRTNLQFLGLDRPIRSIQLTSSNAAEGKTTVSTNLAVVLAQAGHRVALVDCDLRRPRVHEVFGIEQGPGFTDLLLGVPPKRVVRQIAVDDTHNLSVYPAGAVPSNPSELLSGRRTQRLLTEMADYYDFVVIDSAPILPVSDSLALSGSADAVCVVVQAGKATDDQLASTLERLDRVGAPVIGLVLNQAANVSQIGYTYGGYNAYTRGGELDSENTRSAIDTSADTADIPRPVLDPTLAIGTADEPLDDLTPAEMAAWPDPTPAEGMARPTT